MRLATMVSILLLCTFAVQPAQAQADRESLLEAWVEHMAALPSTARLESIGDGVYQFHDTDLPYEGELKIVGALVRSTESVTYEPGFSHLGMVDFELVDWPLERASSQVYYYWYADRQSLYFSDKEQRWVHPAAYQSAITGLYGDATGFGAMSFMLNYGIWVLLIGLLIFVFIAIGKQSRKARSLMDESGSINQKASENLDRAERLQDEALAIARESRDLLKENNELLRKLLATDN